MEDRSLSIRARKKVKAEYERKERERGIALFTKRMELARDGALFFKNGKLKEAANSYYSYLAILEKTKSAKPGALEPRHFDPKKDVAELLLLSGVFWDLAKLHDRVSKKNNVKVKLYLDRYVVFSKGMPFQHISSELVRKYLINGMPRYRGDFKDAHVRLGGGKCFIATAVEEHCASGTLSTLRWYRDQKLLRSFGGRVFVRIYYKFGPSLARVVIRCQESFQKKIAHVLDRIALRIFR